MLESVSIFILLRRSHKNRNLSRLFPDNLRHSHLHLANSPNYSMRILAAEVSWRENSQDTETPKAKNPGWLRHMPSRKGISPDRGSNSPASLSLEWNKKSARSQKGHFYSGPSLQQSWVRLLPHPGWKYPCAGGLRVSWKERTDPGSDLSGVWKEIHSTPGHSSLPAEE